MLFNSLMFLIFFPIVTIVYYIVPAKWKTVWLLVTSYFYYMCWGPGYLVFLMLSTVSTYLCGWGLEKAGRRTGRGRWLMIACLILNLGLLVVFKYTHFLIDSLNAVLSGLGMTVLSNDFQLILPVGISFYTLQAIGYMMDVYRGNVPAERNFLRYALFVSFFPQILSGPIGRAGSLLPQLREPKPFRFEAVRGGLLRMLWGLFMKLVITERLAILANTVFDTPGQYAGFTMAAAALAFGLQIYCDFASYSHLAIGAGEVLQIRLMENFNTPYFAKSVAEFWRRWHISLSTWFRDYIYIPLGGSRKGKWVKYRNLMIVFIVSGLWHGANWTFLIWGGLNGLYQIVGDSTQALRSKISTWLHWDRKSWEHQFCQALLTFLLIDFSWIFFRANSTADALLFIRNLFGEFNPWVFFDGSLLKLGLTPIDFFILVASLLVVLGAGIAKYKGVSVRDRLTAQSLPVRWTVYYAGIFAVLLLGIYGPAYTASNFIYSQF